MFVHNNLQGVMSRNVVSVTPEQSVQEAAALMTQHNIGALPVMKNGQLCGIITDRDITTRSTASGAAATSQVGQCMSNNCVSATPNMTADEAAALMAQNQVRRLPVVENNQVVGMVSLGDFATKTPDQQEAGPALSSISQNGTTQA
ncbi:CBS domain-containing protein [Guptibacillus algicola]|uniref:CBS domain-containing protein n=1 Tax=Guptibacillus algicola TaxID=225844 RepID=UPI001CD2EAC6|nr:CBS domain-containing protein [Alkalihalobacillus algicola]MCA0989233.1 CBS domain-containing protein [Alkalihalobacillus algicola]